MKFPKYISPSSLGLFKQNREKYFIKYMSGLPKENFTSPAMAVGSGFDAFIKDRISQDLGLGEFDRFEEQVVPELRDFARKAGMICYDKYVATAYPSLLKQLEKSIITPAFEFKLADTVFGVPMFGYPDLFFITEQQLPVIVDFKVNGYCSATGVKPKGTFVESWPAQSTRNVVLRQNYKGLKINAATPFEGVDKSWATQMTMYCWMMGYQEEFGISIEQLAWKNNEMITARHAGRPSPAFKEKLKADLQEMWTVVMSGSVCENQDTIMAAMDDPLLRAML